MGNWEEAVKQLALDRHEQEKREARRCRHNLRRVEGERVVCALCGEDVDGA